MFMSAATAEKLTNFDDSGYIREFYQQVSKVQIAIMDAIENDQYFTNVSISPTHLEQIKNLLLNEGYRVKCQHPFYKNHIVISWSNT